MSSGFLKAMMLMNARRYDLAEAELRRLVLADPGDAFLHQMLARALAAQEKLPAALKAAEEAVRLAPDDADSHHALAAVRFDADDHAGADAAVARALEIDPRDADSLALLAGIRRQQRRWAESLAAAERGLAEDPQHAACGSLRSAALSHLGRSDEAQASLADALARDPEDEVAHCNLGWDLLHRGRPDEAIVHFREALRIDPKYEHARDGLLEALKGRNRSYARLLQGLLWYSRLPGWVQWAGVIGFLLALRGARAAAGADPYGRAIARWVGLAAVLFWMLFAASGALFTLALRFNADARRVLTADERRASNVHAVLLALMVLALATWRFVLFLPTSFLAAAVCAFLTQLVSEVYRCPPGRARRTMALYVFGAAVVGALAVVASHPFAWLAAGFWIAPGAIWWVAKAMIPLAIAFVLLGYFADDVRGWLARRERMRHGRT